MPMHAPHDHDELARHEEHHERLTMLLWALFFFSLAIYAKFPGLDLLVSAHYYSPELGFFNKSHPVVMALYDWTPWLGRGLVVALALLALQAPRISRLLAARGRQDLADKVRGPWRHLATVSVCCALLGPGLIIEGVFKNTVGRPRPVQVEQFGGTDHYQGPFAIGATPDRNRSFVSSHAAAGFALMSLGLTCGPLWRRRWLLIGIVTGGVVGLGRIMQGGHFLSDIIFAFYAVWLSCEFVSWVDKKRLQRLAAAPTAPSSAGDHTP
ncbi:MAG: phosphatase PAP2 family protein [Aquabacterium sp.]|uniref:phosphatase PAP2 family protein n=1 Tax=Aquabacterium sp. TaxID=1872578 RepID=UPI003BBA516D